MKPPLPKPRVSIFTPTHRSHRWLREASESVHAQTSDDWEWVVLVNNDTASIAPSADDRVRMIVHDEPVVGVGHAKRLAVAHCQGEILIELDHDDLLEPTCVAEVVEAFDQNPEASLVYSRFAQVRADGSPDPTRFDPTYGWEYDDHDGLLIPRSLEPTPHNVSLIWYAPNHVRAFRRSSYEQTSGYDPSLKVLDDLALMNQLYRVGPFVPLDRMLYRQRIHGGNTQLDLDNNRSIQTGSWDLYEQNILANCLTWSARQGLRTALKYDGLPWREDFDPNSYGLIRLYGNDAQRYLDTEMMLECHGLLAPNGMLLIMTPEGVPINEHWFRAWVATENARFQESRIRTVEVDGVKWTQANLIAVKEGYTRSGGIMYARIRR